jgi:hypothetical protein
MTCSATFCGVSPSLECFSDQPQNKNTAETHMCALMIHSSSSSPSSSPPGPPLTARNSLGCHSTFSAARLAASSLCMSSIFVFSSVASSWFLSLTARAVAAQSFCDSRSSCSSKGLACGLDGLAVAPLKKVSLWPFYTMLISRE